MGGAVEDAEDEGVVLCVKKSEGEAEKDADTVESSLTVESVELEGVEEGVEELLAARLPEAQGVKSGDAEEDDEA